MSKTRQLSVRGVSVLLMSIGRNGAHAATIADWTFETSQPAAAGPFAPEVGSGARRVSTRVQRPTPVRLAMAQRTLSAPIPGRSATPTNFR